MSYKRKWLKKFNVLCVDNSHTNLWNVKNATNYSANIVNYNFNNMETKMTSMQIINLMIDLVDGEALVEPSTTKWHQPEEAAEINSQSLH